MSIVKKLFISLFVLSLLVAITGAVGYLGLRSNHSSIYGFVQDDVPVIESLMSTRIILKDLNAQIAKRDPKIGDEGVQQETLGSEEQAKILANIERLDEEFSRYIQHAGTDSEASNLIREMKKTKALVTNHVLNVLRMKQLGLPEEEWMQHFASIKNEFVLFENQIEQALDYGRLRVWRIRDSVFDQSHFAIMMMIGIVIFSLTAAFVIGIMLVHGIIRPIRGLQDGAQKVAQGDFSVRLNTTSADEIGKLAKSFNDMAASVKENEEKLKEKAEELERSNQELEQFAYVASHDLQEPVRKIVGFTQLIEKNLKDQLDDQTRRHMDYVTDGAKRMQVLIQDLLKYSRVGKAELELEKIDFNEVVQEAINNLDKLIEESSATVNFSDLPTVKAHKVFMVRLVQNLISNSIKYRSEADVVITITSEKKDRHWEFSFIDNGMGIDPEFAEKIFIIFQRLHSREQYEGTGIGLAVCRRMVQRHGGQLWLDTEDTTQSGSTFKFTIPS